MAVVRHPDHALHGPDRGSGHPVCEGVDDFELTDELYCCPVFADEVVPLLRTDADLRRRLFVSTYEHVLHGAEGAPDCSAHPPASDLIGWATVAERSPVVYLQPGDSGATFGLVPYRRLVANALEWVASPAAHEWAGGAPGALGGLSGPTSTVGAAPPCAILVSVRETGRGEDR